MLMSEKGNAAVYRVSYVADTSDSDTGRESKPRMKLSGVFIDFIS